MFGQKKIIEELKKRLILHGYPSYFKWLPMFVDDISDQKYMERTGKMPEDLYNEVIEEANEIYFRVIDFPTYKLSDEEIESLELLDEIKDKIRLIEKGLIDERLLHIEGYYTDFKEKMLKLNYWENRYYRTISTNEMKMIGLYDECQYFIKAKEKIYHEMEKDENYDVSDEQLKEMNLLDMFNNGFKKYNEYIIGYLDIYDDDINYTSKIDILDAIINSMVCEAAKKWFFSVFEKAQDKYTEVDINAKLHPFHIIE